MARICFVSYEIHPTVAGGCGVLLHHSARVLLSRGHEVIFLLDVDPEAFRKFNEFDRLNLPNERNCRAYLVDALVRDLGISPYLFKTLYELKAYRFYQAARQLEQLEKPDIIEFFEYCGVAYHALDAKISGLDFLSSHLTIRLHGSMELIDRQQPGSRHGIDRYVMYGLEHHALRTAETVLYPSQGFLQESYLTYYEPWFGHQTHSQPALLDHPVSDGVSTDLNIILFYGRLFGIKGVDQFIDAAILYLSNPDNPRRLFALVGYDSYLPPTSQGSYQDYLIKKIPLHFRDSFRFLGQLSWSKLGDILPNVLFAVVPSFFESFCYAAHELYQAGIPLILSDIPAFKDSFLHGENSLKFDGTVSDLANKMQLLSVDDALRSKISRPYLIHDQMLGDFYTHLIKESWIRAPVQASNTSLLLCILVDEPGDLGLSLESLRSQLSPNVRVVLMHPVSNKIPGDSEITSTITWFLGRMYAPQDLNGASINPTEIQTMEALLILKSGDILDPDYLSRSLAILNRQPQIAFVGCWKKLRTWKGYRLETLPLDAALDIAPFIQSDSFNRFFMRTPPGELLIDLFDARAGRLGELDYLWQLETAGTTGIMIPQALLTRKDRPEALLDQPALDYLILKDTNPLRKERLARFNLSLANRSRVLRRFHFDRDSSHPIIFRLNAAFHKLATSSISKWMDRLPRLKKALRILLSYFLAILLRLLSILRRKSM